MDVRKIPKISLVQANDSIGGNIILPLAIGILWASATANKNWKLEHVIYRKDAVDQTAELLAQSDVVAMSMYVWNSKYHYELASAIKKINPQCWILVGGPDIHENSNIWKIHKDVIDLAIVGEGEYSFNKILQQWPEVDITSIPGAWTAEYYNGEAPRVSDLENFPSPYLTGFYDNIVKESLKENKKIQAVIQTNRGCPYHCAFCEEGRDYKNKIHFYDTERILDEINWCGKNQVDYLSIADDNWGIAERDVDLVEHICQTKVAYGFPNVMDATYAKNAPERLLKIALIDNQYGTKLIRGLTVALQSLNSNTLNSIKRFNLIDAKQAELISGLKKLSIPTYVEMIWPLPEETLDTFRAGIDRVIDNGTANWLAVYPLNLLSSTDLYKRFREDYEYPLDTGQHIVDDFYPSEGTYPVANKWCDHQTVVSGHVLYGWVAVLHYFGFAHVALEYLKKHRNWSITDSIIAFREFLKDNHSAIAVIDNAYAEYWSDWLNRRTTKFSIFPEDQTQFWYPYTHLAARVQDQFDCFYQVLEQFLKSIGVENYQSIAKLSKAGTVRYTDQFPDLVAFSQHYYWFNRKRGLSKLPVDQ